MAGAAFNHLVNWAPRNRTRRRVITQPHFVALGSLPSPHMRDWNAPRAQCVFAKNLDNE